jgi:extracellular factor (EF) 3-hydroxypalmitic acid methyl ester biosynthesis protein
MAMNNQFDLQEQLELSGVQIETILESVVAKGGPEPDEYPIVTDCFRQLWEAGISSFQISSILAPTLTEDCIQGFCYRKPHGYAGDFEIIERLHTGWVSPNPSLARWDRYLHAQPAARAVVNRREVFGRLLRELNECCPQSPTVLNVGCGGARDVYEYYMSEPDSLVRVHSIDISADAIAQAATLCEPFAERARFERKNVFRFRTNEKFDLVWSAGLFDYLNEDTFVAVVRRLLTMIKPGGRAIIGNFNTVNPTRPYMELAGEWYLNHRSAQDLIELAKRAGAAEEQISVLHEVEHVNLFLEIRKSVVDFAPPRST